MTLADNMEKAINATINDQRKMRSALNTLGVETNVLRKVAPLDDGTPPGIPANVVIQPFIRTLAINWDTPDSLDAVERVELSVTSQNESIEVAATDSIRGHTVMDLKFNEDYTVMLRFIDFFDRAGEWSAPITARPLPDPKTGIAELRDDMLGVINDNLDDVLFTGPNGRIPESKFETIEDAATFGNDIILARMMVTQDAIALRQWIGTAAIENAMIASLTASKITAGDIDANEVTVSGQIRAIGGGVIKGGGGSITPDGFILNSVPSGITWPSVSKADWLTSATGAASTPFPYAGLTFFTADSNEVSRPQSRGVLISASGISSTARIGRIRIQVSDGIQDHSRGTSAYLDLASVGQNAGPDEAQLMVNASTRIMKTFYPRTDATLTIGSGVTAEFNSQGGAMSKLYTCYFHDGGGLYRPFIHNNNGFRTSVENDSSGIGYITNENSGSRTVKVHYYG